MCKMQYVRHNVQGTMCKMNCVNGSASQTNWTDQLDRPAGQTSWADQFFLFEAFGSLHIRRFSFQFVHCRSFRVRRRPCFLIYYLEEYIFYLLIVHQSIMQVRDSYCSVWKSFPKISSYIWRSNTVVTRRARASLSLVRTCRWENLHKNLFGDKVLSCEYKS